MTVYRDLPVKLTDEEWNKIAEELVDAQDQLRAIEAEKSLALAMFRDRTKRCKAVLAGLSEKLRTHEEVRPVECCEHVGDDGCGVVSVFVQRNDTGEVVEVRKATLAERQVILPGVSQVEGG